MRTFLREHLGRAGRLRQFSRQRGNVALSLNFRILSRWGCREEKLSLIWEPNLSAVIEMWKLLIVTNYDIQHVTDPSPSPPPKWVEFTIIDTVHIYFLPGANKSRSTQHVCPLPPSTPTGGGGGDWQHPYPDNLLNGSTSRNFLPTIQLLLTLQSRNIRQGPS